jgi:hypothetical protein
VRVLKHGGKLGVTAWAAGRSEHARLWRHIAESFAGTQAVRRTIDTHQPWSDWFTDPGHVASALRGSGLRTVYVEQREYAVTITAAEYLSRMESSLVGRWMRHTMGTVQWDEFQHAAAREFASQFPERFTIFPRANLGVATK